jgi:hypothetical protein
LGDFSYQEYVIQLGDFSYQEYVTAFMLWGEMIAYHWPNCNLIIKIL